MASPFDDLDHMISSAVESAFGEPAVIVPRVSHQYVERAADVDRREASVIGIFSAGPAEGQIKGNAVGGEFKGTTRLGLLKSEFWLAANQVAALGFQPQRGDAVTFTGRPGSPVYSVAGVQRTDRGDVALILVSEDQGE